MAKKVEFEMGGAQAMAVIDALEQRAAALEARLRSIASILGSGGGTRQDTASFFGALEDLGATKGAISAARGSVVAGGGITAATIAAGAAAGTAAFGTPMRSRIISDPIELINQARAVGLSGSALTSVGMELSAGGKVPFAPSHMGSAAQVLQQMVAATQVSQQINPFSPTGAAFPSSAWSPYGATVGAMNPFSPTGGAYASSPWSPYVSFQQGQQQQQRQAQQRSQVNQVALGVGMQVLGQGLSLYANQTASGNYDPMTAAGLYGGATGAIIGGVSGFFIGAAAPVPEPGLGSLIGSQLGMSLGSSAAQAAIAPFVRTRNAEITLASIAAREGRGSKGVFGAPGRALGIGPRGIETGPDNSPASGLSDLASTISSEGKTLGQRTLISAGLYTGIDMISGPDIAKVYASFGSGLLAAGENNPDELTGLTSRFSRRYGAAAAGLAGSAASVMALRAKFNNNAADMLLASGPEAFGLYSDATGGADLTPRQMSAYAGVQRNTTLAQIGSLKARGSGAAAATAIQATINDIKTLPGGADSLANAQSEAQLRDAVAQDFEQKNTVAYGIPAAKLQGAIDRSNYLPFSPSNRYRLGLQQIGMNVSEIGTLQAYMRSRKATGQLSEDEELSITNREQGLMTQNAANIGLLQGTMDDQLPGMNAGRPASFTRFDSSTLAAMRLGRMGSARRGYGAINGAQKQMQDDYATSFGAGDIAPFSRMQGLDNAGVSGALSTLTTALNRVADALLSGGRSGSSQTPGQAAGAAAGVQGAASLPQRPAGWN